MASKNASDSSVFEQGGFNLIQSNTMWHQNHQTKMMVYDDFTKSNCSALDIKDSCHRLHLHRGNLIHGSWALSLVNIFWTQWFFWWFNVSVWGIESEPPIWTMDDNVFLVPQCGITIVVNGSMRNNLTNKKDAAGDHNRFPPGSMTSTLLAAFMIMVVMMIMMMIIVINYII